MQASGSAFRLSARYFIPSALLGRAAMSGGGASQGFKLIVADTAASLIKGGSHVFVDVRTPAEFASEHVEGSVNIPIMIAPGGYGEVDPHASHDNLVKNENFVTEIKQKFSADKGLVLSCMYGRRGGKATKELEEAGFKDVASLEGGLEAWVKKELPVWRKTA